jgi:hypothetical protein
VPDSLVVPKWCRDSEFGACTQRWPFLPDPFA